MRNGDFAKAEMYINEALSADPNYALTYVQKAELAVLRGDFAGAEQLYRKAVELDPGRIGPAAYSQLGMMYLRLMRTEQAREAFEKALAIDSLYGAAHAGLGSLLAEEGRFDEAREHVSPVVRLLRPPVERVDPYDADTILGAQIPDRDRGLPFR